MHILRSVRVDPIRAGRGRLRALFAQPECTARIRAPRHLCTRVPQAIIALLVRPPPYRAMLEHTWTTTMLRPRQTVFHAQLEKPVRLQQEAEQALPSIVHKGIIALRARRLIRNIHVLRERTLRSPILRVRPGALRARRGLIVPEAVRFLQRRVRREAIVLLQQLRGPSFCAQRERTSARWARCAFKTASRALLDTTVQRDQVRLWRASPDFILRPSEILVSPTVAHALPVPNARRTVQLLPLSVLWANSRLPAL